MLNNIIDLEKFSKKPSFTVVQESFDDINSLKVYMTPFINATMNSIVLKGGFETIEEAEAWKEKYREDPTIWTEEDRFKETIEGLKLLNELSNFNSMLQN